MNIPDQDRFSSLLEEGRGRKGWDQKRAVQEMKRAGVKIGLSTLARYEQGGGVPDLEKARAMLAVLGYNVDGSDREEALEGVATVEEMTLSIEGLTPTGERMHISRNLLESASTPGRVCALKLANHYSFPNDLQAGDTLFIEIFGGGSGRSVEDLYEAGELGAKGMYVLSVGRYPEVGRLIELEPGVLELLGQGEAYPSVRIDVGQKPVTIYARVLTKMRMRHKL